MQVSIAMTRDWLIIGIIVVASIVWLYYDDRKKRKKVRTCPQCKKWEMTTELARIEKSDMLLPRQAGYDTVLVKYQCGNCGHRWDDFEYVDNSYG
jgi:hypothetical protein